MNLSCARRLLIGFAAILLLAGAGFHASVFFSGVGAQIGDSRLSRVLVNEARMLWLADSSTLAIVGLGLALMAARSQVRDRALALLLLHDSPAVHRGRV